MAEEAGEQVEPAGAGARGGAAVEDPGVAGGDDAGVVEASGKHLALLTRDGMNVASTDFFLRWQARQGGARKD